MRFLGREAMVFLVLILAAVPALSQAVFFEAELGTDIEKLVDKAKLDMMSMGHGTHRGNHQSKPKKAADRFPDPRPFAVLAQRGAAALTRRL